MRIVQNEQSKYYKWSTDLALHTRAGERLRLHGSYQAPVERRGRWLRLEGVQLMCNPLRGSQGHAGLRRRYSPFRKLRDGPRSTLLIAHAAASAAQLCF